MTLYLTLSFASLAVAALTFYSGFGLGTLLMPVFAIFFPVEVVMALLMTVFALFELLPCLRKLTFSSRHLVVGGLLSGFFGGFSSHQGALRSAFLAKLGLSAESLSAPTRSSASWWTWRGSLLTSPPLSLWARVLRQ